MKMNKNQELYEKYKKQDDFSFEELKEVVKLLRNECPWDSVQTHESLVGCLMEEAGEVKEAIQKKDSDNLKEELGDLLFLILLQSEIAGESLDFDLQAVISGIAAKMIHRHPVIFGGGEPVTWEELKAEERKDKKYKRKLDEL